MHAEGATYIIACILAGIMPGQVTGDSVVSKHRDKRLYYISLDLLLYIDSLTGCRPTACQVA